ncbi:MAG: MFS transporter [Clostridia bacterium]|nr:MFS transporter [Clostridia bacterium]
MKAISSNAKKAIMIGIMCSLSYLSVSLARNILSAVSPHILENGIYSEEQLGTLSSVYFLTYAIGQLINGILGNKIIPKYMISLGLSVGSVCIFSFYLFSDGFVVPAVAYGILGFCLSMIFAPMTRLIAENVDPSLTARTTAMYTFAALFGSPIAGLMAVGFYWNTAFLVTGGILLLMGIVCFITFISFEKRGYIRYLTQTKQQKKRSNISLLLKRSIVRFTVISFVTGIIRSSVIFWLPTYLSQYLGFSPDTSSLLFTVGTLVVSASPFVSVFLYEKIGSRLLPTVLISLISSSVCFAGVFFIKTPVLNLILILLAILSSGSADSIMWSVYCPSLKDTGMVSGATGYLDFVSYLAAALSSTLFANLVGYIGWRGLILVWFGLMATGILTCFKKQKQP